jgi:hypothetical protein
LTSIYLTSRGKIANSASFYGFRDNDQFYVVGSEKNKDYKFQNKEKTYIQSGEVFVKTYRELLE